MRKTAQLGEVVAVAFDRAAHYSNDPQEVSRLATQAIAFMLRPRWKPVPSLRWPSFPYAGDML